MQLHVQADGMKAKYLTVLIVFILASNYFILSDYVEDCKADVLPKFYVDDNYNSSTPGWQVDHFCYIQDAINLSEAGDRIIVYAGTYYERITIDHRLDLFGEDRNITFINAGSTDSVLTITAEHVNISHFTIKYSGANTYDAGVTINASYAIITDNIITNSKHGISINNCNGHIIYDNMISSNSGNGIRLNHSNSNYMTYNTITSNLNGLFLYNSSNNSIENNTAVQSNSNSGIFLNETSNYNSIANNVISSNTKNGIFLNDRCDYNTMSRNNIYSNSESGIRSENSSNNDIDNSTISSNDDYGIMIVGSNNVIIDNTISINEEHGIFLFADDNSRVTENTITGNTKDGISLSNSTADLIYKNEISDNLVYGLQLDFFSISNTIYNNYFHGNTVNSMDKSITKNYWNITKTSGTNIVGGPYLCGNYWDNFDEVSEGATDPNGDGISNDTYTIYASNKDYGPLLDVTPPSVGAPSVSPTAQTIGSYTYISVTITDNTEIKGVYLQLGTPSGQTTNFSILQNKTGNTYYCNKQFSPVGTYTFCITVKDPRNWASSSSGTFYIIEGIPPTVTDNTPKTGSPSNIFIFNATVTDDMDIASQLTVKVNWRHKDYSSNYSMVNIYRNFFVISIILDNSTEDLTYYIFARDQWGNSVTTAEKTVKVVDTQAPSITVEKYGASSDDMPNKYTFGATITDDTEVQDVRIEYWYNDNEHITVNMDKKESTYYEKDIQLNQSVDRLYCIMNATDPSGNNNDTTAPFANVSGPYTGVITIQVDFDATNSYDLDGDIADYSWDFGDGTNGSGATTSHIYSAVGNFTVALTVTDDDGNTNTDTTYVTIIQSTQIKPSSETIAKINRDYSLALTELFYSYDTDGDCIVDKFIDPNDVLKAVKEGINISGEMVFLLSKDDEYVPEFMWNTATDEITNISYVQVPISEGDVEIDELNEQGTIQITVEKVDWIFIEIDDIYPSSEISVATGDRTISSDMIIRKNGKIYIFDDASTVYTITFSNVFADVKAPSIYPGDGFTISEDSKTITITYNVPVQIIYASFGDLRVESELTTSDNIVFYYTPPGYLETDTWYDFTVTARAIHGESQNTLYATFFYQAYALAPVPPEKSIIEKNLIWIILGSIFLSGIALLVVSKRKNISFESFIYVKNRKIIPFFKPLVFGPLKIDVDNENVKKAEFYVNGQLKDTIMQPPYVWNWNEKSFMKQKIETKVYDENDNVSSSGEMTFFIFNSPRLFK